MTEVSIMCAYDESFWIKNFKMGMSEMLELDVVALKGINNADRENHVEMVLRVW